MKKEYKKFFKWFNPQYYQFLILAIGPQTKDVIETIRKLAKNDWSESIGKCFEFYFASPLGDNTHRCLFKCEGVDLDTTRRQPVLKGSLISININDKSSIEFTKNYVIPFNIIETGFCHNIKEVSLESFKFQLNKLTK